MDEDLTPGRGAADAADAGSASGVDHPGGRPGGWGRLQDGLGDPAGWRTDEGGERDALPPAAGPDDVPAADAGADADTGADTGADRTVSSGGGSPSLVELTGEVVTALRVATTGACPPGVQGWRLSTGEVLAGFADLGEARARLEVAEQVLLGEVLARGLAAEAGFSVHDFVRQALGRRAPLPEVAAVAAAVQVARATARVSDDGAGPGPAGGSRDRVPGAEAVREAVFSTALPVGRAAKIVRFAKDVAPVADEADLAEWVAGFVTGASDHLDGDPERGPDAPGGGRGVDGRELTRGLRQAALLVTPAKDLEDDERRQRMGRSFTRTDGGCSANGMASYRLTLDPEGAAIVDSAVSALSAPRRLEYGALEPGETTDPRSAGTRRADALLDLVSRAVAAGGTSSRADRGDSSSDASNTDDDSADGEGGAGDGATTSGARAGAVHGPLPGLGDKAQVLVTIDYDALTGALDRAGITSTGEVLSPATVRRLACDAGIIPAVLGAHSQVLDLGRTRRLFTPAQRLVVWRRDKHCSYPGCTIPATWCDVHHVHWWSRGGPTDLTNAALLCRRHHTHVHTHDLTATVTPGGVRWHAPPPTPPTRT